MLEHYFVNMRRLDEMPLPEEESIATVAGSMLRRIQEEESDRKYATVKQVLALVGAGVLVGILFAAPQAGIIFKAFRFGKREYDPDQWKHFNPSYLKRSLSRLQRQKLVEITQEPDGTRAVTITKGGRRRLLKYALETLAIPTPKAWDGKWRLVIYDVAKPKRKLRDVFREMLKGLGFYMLQESVWLYPYPCEKEVTFLREYYGVGNEVVYVVAIKLEDDSPYQTYFNLL